MTHAVSQPDNPDLLRQTLAELKTAYTALFDYMARSLEADPEEAASQALAFNGQIRQLTQEIDVRLGLLLDRIAPWDRRRALFPADLADDVDRFLATLGPGLAALQEQLRHRVADVEHRMAHLRKNLAHLGRQQQGVGGYKPGADFRKRIDKKA